MPPAIIGLALVAAGTITAATLGYVALGVTVAGMVTKNKTLMKIGGQLGLAAGVAGIATSFMGAGASAASTAGNVAKVATGAQSLQGEPSSALTGDIDTPSETSIHASGAPYTDTPKQIADSGWDKAPDYGGITPAGSADNMQPVALPSSYKAPEMVSPDKYGQGANLGADAGANLGVTQNLGANVGANVGNIQTPNNTSTRSTPDKNFFSFLDSDINKRMLMEGGKIVAGGLQGMATTSAANTQLAENRRVDDIRRANAGSVGRSSYGVGGLMQAR